MKVKSNENFHLWFIKKTSVLVALFNAAVLLISVTLIIYESAKRLMHPEQLPGKTIAIIAGMGILVNGISAYLFLKNKEDDVECKKCLPALAFRCCCPRLELWLAALLFIFTSWFWLDPVIGIIIGIVILAGTFNLFKNSLRLSLDGVPENIHLQKIKSAAQKNKRHKRTASHSCLGNEHNRKCIDCAPCF